MTYLFSVSYLAKKLFSMRKEQNIPLSEVSRATGISQASLSAYEKGSYTPGIDNLCRLADFFDISLDELLGRSPR